MPKIKRTTRLSVEEFATQQSPKLKRNSKHSSYKISNTFICSNYSSACSFLTTAFTNKVLLQEYSLEKGEERYAGS